MIPHSRPWITGEDRTAVAAVLGSEQIGQGLTTAAFEAAFSRWLDVATVGVAVSSGAAALQLALAGLGVGAGDEVIIPTYVCRSVRDAVLTVGALPRLADVGPGWVLTPATVAPLVNARTRAVVVPHLYGIYADIAAFRRFGVPIVEDCAQAVGHADHWAMTGDIGVFSFHPTKCFTAGEGGLALAGDPLLNRRLRAIRDGGGRHRRVLAPLSDLAAALAQSQLSRYAEALHRRSTIAETYRRALGPNAGSYLRRIPWQRTMHFRFPLSCAGGLEAAEPAFADEGIVVRRGVDQLLHRIAGESDASYPMATELFETTISIPIYPALSEGEIGRCAAALAAWACREAPQPRVYQSTTM